MALMHHSPENYDLAAARASAVARDKLDSLISKGREHAMRVYEQIHTTVPNDAVPRAAEVVFEAVPVGESDAARLRVRAPGVELSGLHRNAVAQVAERADMPVKYLNTLLERGRWGTDLAAHALSTTFSHAPEASRVLVRSVGGEVRGLLSDRYRRLDSRPLVAAFASAAQAAGAVPVEGYALETKVALKAVLPRIYEPVKNEVMVFGVAWSNSDFGNGTHSLRIFTMRLVCTNYAIAEESMRDVHLGRRLSGDVQFSARTLELDTQTTASAIGDVVRGQLSEARIDAFQAAIRRANEEAVDPKRAEATLRRRLTKTEADEVITAFNSPDVVNMPPGSTNWRLSNAVSWIAGQKTDKERALEMMSLAGEMVPIGRAA